MPTIATTIMHFLKMMDGAVSGKTGFTETPDTVMWVRWNRMEKTYIVALLACGWPNNRTYKWSDTRKLMEYGLAAYERCGSGRYRTGREQICTGSR